MFSFLKNHPFPVKAWFDESLVLTFAVPADFVLPMLPPCLEPDLFNDTYAFIAAAMVRTRQLRPAGFPAFLGRDFFLIGFRIFVKYLNNDGRRLRGLYILKSETDKKSMEHLGNIFTRYSYQTTDIFCSRLNNSTAISSDKSDFRIVYDDKTADPALPTGSPFSTWKEARRFAGPLPFSFSYLAEKQQVLIVEGVRSNWVPLPVSVTEYHFSYLKKLGLDRPVLANAFQVRDIPYQWKKGKLETWKS